MKTIKELLQIMLDNPNYFRSGLCRWAESLCYRHPFLITDLECRLLKEYIKSNRPNWLSSIDAFKRRDSVFYWKPDNIEPRIKWIKKHIKKQGLRL